MGGGVSYFQIMETQNEFLLPHSTRVFKAQAVCASQAAPRVHEPRYKQCAPQAQYWELMQSVGFPVGSPWHSAQDCVDALTTAVQNSVSQHPLCGLAGQLTCPDHITFQVKDLVTAPVGQAPHGAVTPSGAIDIPFAPSMCAKETRTWKLFNFTSLKDCVDTLSKDPKTCPQGTPAAAKCPPFSSTIVSTVCSPDAPSGDKCAFADDPSNHWAGQTSLNDVCTKTTPGDVCTVARPAHMRNTHVRVSA